MSTDAEILAAGELNFKSLSGMGEAIGASRKRKKDEEEADLKKANTQLLAEKMSETPYGQTAMGQVEALGVATGVTEAGSTMGRFSGISAEELMDKQMVDPRIARNPELMMEANRAFNIYNRAQKMKARYTEEGKAEGGNLSYTQIAARDKARGEGNGLKVAKAIEMGSVAKLIGDSFSEDGGDPILKIPRKDIGFKDDDGFVEIDLNKSWLQNAQDLSGDKSGGFLGIGSKKTYTSEQIDTAEETYFNTIEDGARAGIIANAPYLSNKALKPNLDAAVKKAAMRIAMVGLEASKQKSDGKGNFEIDMEPVPEWAYRSPMGDTGEDAPEVDKGTMQAIQKAPIEDIKSFVLSQKGLPADKRAIIEADLTGAAARKAAEFLVRKGILPPAKAPAVKESAPAPKAAPETTPPAEKPQSKAAKPTFFGTSAEASKYRAKKELPALEKEYKDLEKVVAKEKSFGYAHQRKSANAVQLNFLKQKISKYKQMMS